MILLGKELDSQIKRLVKDLSDPEVYPRKHAAWTLARLVQTGKARSIVDSGAVPKLAKNLEDTEAIVRGRALWALYEIAKHGERDAVLQANIVPIVEQMASDRAQLEICNRQSSDIIYTTIGAMAKEILEYLN